MNNVLTISSEAQGNTKPVVIVKCNCFELKFFTVDKTSLISIQWRLIELSPPSSDQIVGSYFAVGGSFSDNASAYVCSGENW